MTVRVSLFSINRGGSTLGSVRTFSDTFNRASGILGQNWIQCAAPFAPVVDPITSATFGIGVCTDVAQGMIVTNVGTGNPNTTWGAGLFAAPLYMSCLGKSQFSEWLMITNDRVGANDSFGGPAVLQMNAGLGSVGTEKQGLFSYHLMIFASNKSYTLNRGNTQTATAINTGGAASFANGDVIRLEAVVNPGDVTLTIKRNGSVVNTTVDNAAGRILTGSPGWFGQGFDNSGAGSMTSQWRNFNGGLL